MSADAGPVLSADFSVCLQGPLPPADPSHHALLRLFVLLQTWWPSCPLKVRSGCWWRRLRSATSPSSPPSSTPVSPLSFYPAKRKRIRLLKVFSVQLKLLASSGRFQQCRCSKRSAITRAAFQPLHQHLHWSYNKINRKLVKSILLTCKLFNQSQSAATLAALHWAKC